MTTCFRSLALCTVVARRGLGEFASFRAVPEVAVHGRQVAVGNGHCSFIDQSLAKHAPGCDRMTGVPVGEVLCFGMEDHQVRFRPIKALIRHSLEFVSWKDRKPVVPALRAIYRAKNAEAGMKALEDFEAGLWGHRYPAITQSWRRNWSQVVPFFAYPESVRRIIYTTNQIEALNSKLRRAVRARGHFPTDEAAIKLLYLVLNHVAEEWKRPPREWIEVFS